MELPIIVELVPQQVQGDSDTLTDNHPWDH